MVVLKPNSCKTKSLSLPFSKMHKFRFKKKRKKSVIKLRQLKTVKKKITIS